MAAAARLAAVALACAAVASGAPSCTGPATPIHRVQGVRHASPLVGETVTVEGRVTRVAGRFLYIQTPPGDEDRRARTSEGLLVFGRASTDFAEVPDLAVGALARAEGVVTEFAQRDGLTITEVVIQSNDDVAVCDAEVVEVPAVTVGAGAQRQPPTRFIYRGEVNLNTCGDECPVLRPRVNGIDFWESLEGQKVTIKDAAVVGADRFGNFFVVPSRGFLDPASLNARGGVTIDPRGRRPDFNPEVIKVLTSASPGDLEQPEIGDFSGDITGVMDINFDFWTLILTETPDITPGPEDRKREGPTRLTSTPSDLTIASYNIENFPGDLDDETEADLAAIAEQVATLLGNPAVVALQEQQDNDGNANTDVVDGDVIAQRLTAAIAAAGGPSYTYVEVEPVDDQDGGRPGGNIRVAYLYDAERVALAPSGEGRAGGPLEATVAQAAPGGGVRLSLNPGRVDPENEAFDRSRKPLAAHFVLKATGTSYYVVNNHFSSKGGSDPLHGPVQPPANGSEEERTAQARVVNAFVRDILCRDAAANVVVLGDLNEFDPFPPLQALQEGGILFDLLRKLPLTDRYTFNFQGNSQALDHVYVSPALRRRSLADVLHVNTGLVTQPTDHDPVTAVIRPGPIPRRLRNLDISCPA